VTLCAVKLFRRGSVYVSRMYFSVPKLVIKSSTVITIKGLGHDIAIEQYPPSSFLMGSVCYELLQNALVWKVLVRRYRSTINKAERADHATFSSSCSFLLHNVRYIKTANDPQMSDIHNSKKGTLIVFNNGPRNAPDLPVNSELGSLTGLS
jgi:hypothetical protein